MKTRLLFKVTHLDGRACHGGRGVWPLPTPSGPGAPRPAVEGPLEPCRNGYHYCTALQLVRWLGPAIHLVNVPEGMEEQDVGDKLVGRGPIRLERTLTHWTPAVMAAFAEDCARRVAHLREYRTFAHAAAADARAAYAAYAASADARAAADADDAADDAAHAAVRRWQADRLQHYLQNGLGG